MYIEKNGKVYSKCGEKSINLIKKPASLLNRKTVKIHELNMKLCELKQLLQNTIKSI